ncbi:MAG TPA: hypothetical protein VK249_27470 [Anaerolineales bacterium]|nr:hypothetical protein [Anaerolineales bacterium]
MNEQEDFFSPKHNRLLSIATWAKYLAWLVLIVYIVSAGTQVIQFQNNANYRAAIANQPSQGLKDSLTENPLSTFRLGINMAAVIIKGVVYYLALKGISLGLNMIIETDINYRDRKQEEVVQ